MSDSKREQYLKIRNDSKAYVEKVIKFSTDKNLINKGARMLGMLGRNKNLILHEEEDINFLMDFIIFERIRNKKNAVMNYLEHHELDDYEQEIFDMFLNSYTSLFVIDEIDIENSTLKIIDYFTEEWVEIVDVGLAKTAMKGLPIFFRKMQYRDIAFTSGVSYLIGPHFSSFEGLHNEIQKTLKSIKEKDDSVKRFIAFKKLSDKYGLDIEFRNAQI